MDEEIVGGFSACNQKSGVISNCLFVWVGWGGVGGIWVGCGGMENGWQRKCDMKFPCSTSRVTSTLEQIQLQEGRNQVYLFIACFMCIGIYS